MNEKVMLRVYALAGVIAVIAFLSWADKHDAQVADAADRYEKCVLEEYGMNPARYRLETGEYPVCDTEKVDTLREYYQTHVEEQGKIERLIRENPSLTDEEILQIVNG